MKPREYQTKIINDIFREMGATQNLLVTMPTGTGKSVVIATFCRQAINQYQDTNILVLAHVKELLEQNAAKLQAVWPEAPIGVYSAGLNSKQTNKITVAGIQSIINNVGALVRVDIIVIDEAHRINHKVSGSYRKLITALLTLNPNMRLLGLTATPFRTGHGRIYGEGQLFEKNIEPYDINYFIDHDPPYLAPLRSIPTKLQLDVTDIKKSKGDFDKKELDAVVNVRPVTEQACAEIVKCAEVEGSKAWLIFCISVEHVQEVNGEILKHGIKSALITGDTDSVTRKKILDNFRAGELQCVVNCNVLTTGFDYPNIDLIAFLRPTCSPTLYVQMAGRGMRIKSHTDHCLVLDFAGNIARLGTVDGVKIPVHATKECPSCGKYVLKTLSNCECGHDFNTQVCPDCNAIVPLYIFTCKCGYQFPIVKENRIKPPVKENKPEVQLNNKASNHAILSRDQLEIEMPVANWQWEYYTSKKGDDMIRCRMFPADYGYKVIAEYYPIVTFPSMAFKKLRMVEKAYDIKLAGKSMEDIIELGNKLPAPESISYKEEGNFPRIQSISFTQTNNYAPPEVDYKDDIPFSEVALDNDNQVYYDNNINGPTVDYNIQYADGTLAEIPF